MTRSSLDTLTLHFANCFCAFLIHLKYIERTCRCSPMMKTSFFWTLSLFITLLIFVRRCDIILKGVLPPYPMYSSLRALKYGHFTAWRMSVQRLSSTPKNFSYLITFLACFFSLLLLSNTVSLSWMVSSYPPRSFGVVQ